MSKIKADVPAKTILKKKKVMVLKDSDIDEAGAGSIRDQDTSSRQHSKGGDTSECDLSFQNNG